MVIFYYNFRFIIIIMYQKKKIMSNMLIITDGIRIHTWGAKA